jgi:hypothetical protein
LRTTIPVEELAVMQTVITFGVRVEPEVTGGWLRIYHDAGTLRIALGPADGRVFRFRGESIYLDYSGSDTCECVYGRSVQELRVAGQDLAKAVVPISLASSS